MTHEIQEVGLATTLSQPPAPAEWVSPVPWDATSGLSLKLSRTAGWVIDAAKKLEALASLRQGWDSYGGDPLKPEAKDFTVRAISWLVNQDLPTPAVVLGSGGT